MRVAFIIGLCLILVGGTIAIDVSAQEPQRALHDSIPGTACNVDADCKYITTDSKYFLCANPTEFSRKFNVSVTINESVDCFCMSQRAGTLNPPSVCRKEEKFLGIPLHWPIIDKIIRFLRSFAELLSL